MNDRCSTVVIGVGSPHGDDQFGWSVIDQLRQRHLFNAKLSKTNNPIDLIPELEMHDRVILVDACVGMPHRDSLQKLSYADEEDRSKIHELPSRSTHDIGLYLALRMAEVLEERTDHVTLWIGRGESFDELAEMSEETSHLAVDCADAIEKELCDARNFAC